MSKFQDCAEKIIEMMTYSSRDNQIQNEIAMDNVIETMLIFLDYDDVLDIIENGVIPRLLPKVNERWFDYIKNKISFLRECNEDMTDDEFAKISKKYGN